MERGFHDIADIATDWIKEAAAALSWRGDDPIVARKPKRNAYLALVAGETDHGRGARETSFHGEEPRAGIEKQIAELRNCSRIQFARICYRDGTIVTRFGVNELARPRRRGFDGLDSGCFQDFGDRIASHGVTPEVPDQ